MTFSLVAGGFLQQPQLGNLLNCIFVLALFLFVFMAWNCNWSTVFQEGVWTDGCMCWVFWIDSKVFARNLSSAATSMSDYWGIIFFSFVGCYGCLWERCIWLQIKEVRPAKDFSYNDDDIYNNTTNIGFFVPAFCCRLQLTHIRWVYQRQQQQLREWVV